MVQLTYFEAPGEERDAPRWVPLPNDVHTVRHGYNLADLQRLTGIAVARARARGLDHADRSDAAWFGIVEALYTAERPPAPDELLHAGVAALYALVRQATQSWGYDKNHPAGDRRMGSFVRYWELLIRSAPSAESRVVDRVAFWQIWPRLAESHRDVLLALAACETRQAAAYSLGLTQVVFDNRLMRARRSFWVLWHEHETPPRRVWGRNDPRRGRRTETRLLADRAQARRCP